MVEGEERREESFQSIMAERDGMMRTDSHRKGARTVSTHVNRPFSTSRLWRNTGAWTSSWR